MNMLVDNAVDNAGAGRPNAPMLLDNRLNHSLWTKALERLRGRLSAENFETWLAPVSFVGLEGDLLRLRIPNRFYADWIQANYLDILVDALSEEASLPTCQLSRLKVAWDIDERLEPLRALTSDADQTPKNGSATLPGQPEHLRVQPVPGRGLDRQAPQSPAPQNRGANHAGALGTVSQLGKGTVEGELQLNPRYVFESFIVGASNQLAHAASVAVASEPGKRFNPLFLYGGVGLGKTHLMHAMGDAIRASHPQVVIRYVSAERFTNEFIWALQNHKIDNFRQRYRQQCDVLLMDDIQFLAGREQTQEEFFHTFNALHLADRQIVVTSDVFPQQIPEMEERLVSRFQSGMVADVQPPELDTRIAIINRKAELEGIHLPREVALFIAQTVRNNVRELEGTLLRLAVKADLLKEPITPELARDVLRGHLMHGRNIPSVEAIQKATCDYFNLRLSDLKSQKRQRSISLPRMIAMYLCRQRLGTSYPELGDRFGGKDHTTVINAVRKVTSLLEADIQVREAVDTLEKRLG